MLTRAGLPTAEAGHLTAIAEEALVEVCSANARDRGWSAETTPGPIGWSSVATWMRRATTGELWSLLP